MTEQLTMLDLRANLTDVLERVAAGEAFHITKRGKVVAILTRAVDVEADETGGRSQIHRAGAKKKTEPTPTQKVAKGMLEIAKQAEDQLNKTSSEEVDDWGLPVEPFPVGMEMGTSKKPANPAPLKPWKTPMGLSKKQQAGQKYDR